MFIRGLGTALPRLRVTQLQCWEAFQGSPQFNWFDPRSRALLKKVLRSRNGIESRHFALDSIEEGFKIDPNTLHQRFLREAPALAATAARKALEEAQIKTSEIDAIFVSTCTGYLCPGLTSYLIELLGLRQDVLALDLVGQGCGAAIPNWRTANSWIGSHGPKPTQVLSICVEICSAAAYLDNDPGVLISACLFGDGAAAIIFSNEPGPRPIQIGWTGSWTEPGDREKLMFDLKDGMLRNVLTPEVPEVAAFHASRLLERCLQDNDLRKDQITRWIFHAGGRDVLQAVREKLELGPDDLKTSEQMLNRIGNVSSPFVGFVLDEVRKEEKAPGLWFACTFGAGFACHGALLNAGTPA